jgi:hypothetical protein
MNVIGKNFFPEIQLFHTPLTGFLWLYGNYINRCSRAENSRQLRDMEGDICNPFLPFPSRARLDRGGKSEQQGVSFPFEIMRAVASFGLLLMRTLNVIGSDFHRHRTPLNYAT